MGSLVSWGTRCGRCAFHRHAIVQPLAGDRPGTGRACSARRLSTVRGSTRQCDVPSQAARDTGPHARGPPPAPAEFLLRPLPPTGDAALGSIPRAAGVFRCGRRAGLPEGADGGAGRRAQSDARRRSAHTAALAPMVARGVCARRLVADREGAILTPPRSEAAPGCIAGAFRRGARATARRRAEVSLPDDDALGVRVAEDPQKMHMVALAMTA